MHDFHALTFRPPAASALTVARNVAHADFDDPAIDVLTDLRNSPIVSVPANESLPQTRRLMQYAGVRLAFVVDGTQAMIGYVTAADLQGERPLKAAGDRFAHHDDLTVGDILTRVDEWASIDIEQLRHASIGDIVETLRLAGRRYLIVTETASRVDSVGQQAAPRPPQMRGLFSASRIERATGLPIDFELRSRSFADLAQALAHN